MRNIYFLIIFCFVQQQIIAQKTVEGEFKYKATYELTYQPDSTDVESSRSEAMVLYLGDKVSRFSSLGKAVGDSLLQNRDKSRKSMAGFARIRSQIPKTKFDYVIFKGIPEEKISYTREVVKDNFQYVQDLDLLDWEIHPESKDIAGYRAQKATTSFAGRNYVAWFTSEIPLPDGPYKFNGLPGLILEISDLKEHYQFKLTDFRILKDPVKFKFVAKDYIRTTEEKLLNIIDEYNQDPFAAMGRHGITFGFEPGQKERMMRERREQLKSDNNPIELK